MTLWADASYWQLVGGSAGGQGSSRVCQADIYFFFKVEELSDKR